MTAPGTMGTRTFPARKSDAAPFQVLHDTRGSVQAESTPSTQEDCVHALHHMAGKAGSQITRARSGTANIDSAHRARCAEDHTASCQTFEVACVSDADAWNCVQI